MTELLFSTEADRALSRMEADESQWRCAGRIHTALDLLEADPGNERNRRRRFHTIDLWGIAVLCGDDEWLIPWEPHADNVVVRHIIPAP